MNRRPSNRAWRSLRKPVACAMMALAPIVARADVDATDAWTHHASDRLVEAISSPAVAPHVALLALLAAMVLGAVHAFSPGHGKAIVGAYLVGSRSTPRHAVFLGLTVTVTHTLVVFAIGLATLLASRFVLPERLVPALSLLSGLLVLGMGLVLLMQRWAGARKAIADVLIGKVERQFRFDGVPPASTDPRPVLRALSTRRDTVSYGMRRPSGSRGKRAVGLDDADGLAHSHGGRVHTHVPPSGTVGWRGLLALGISGGLVPCPSALVLLLAAVALDKPLYGLLLVVAFSVGLALTLIAVGLVFLYARARFRKPHSTSLWLHVLPLMSAALITVVGVVLCYGALTSAGTRTLGA